MDNSPETIELRRKYAALRNEAIHWGDKADDFTAYTITQVMERSQVQTTGPKDYVEFAFHRVHRLRGARCCPKATWLQCACHEAFTCPEHGEKHIGTHD